MVAAACDLEGAPDQLDGSARIAEFELVLAGDSERPRQAEPAPCSLVQRDAFGVQRAGLSRIPSLSMRTREPAQDIGHPEVVPLSPEDRERLLAVGESEVDVSVDRRELGSRAKALGVLGYRRVLGPIERFSGPAKAFIMSPGHRPEPEKGGGEAKSERISRPTDGCADRSTEVVKLAFERLYRRSLAELGLRGEYLGDCGQPLHEPSCDRLTLAARPEALACIVVDGLEHRLGPQLSYLQEISSDPRLVRERLAHARVTVVGLGAVGTVAATALAASSVGYVRCVDDSEVSTADPHLAQLFELTDVDSLRAEVAGEKIRAVNPDVSVDIRTGPLRTGEDVAGAVDASDFVLGCLDPGLAAITDTLNGACLARRTPWSHGTATAFEGIVGPTVIPYQTACYRCYLARTVACQDDPAGALRELEARYDDRVDMSAYRENIPFAAGIVGHLLALQAFHFLAGLWPRSAGRILVVDFLTSTMREHVVLRKPWCSACFAAHESP